MRLQQHAWSILVSLMVVALCSLPAAVHGQVVSPNTAEFSPSPDHDATADGVPIVSRYDLAFFQQGATAPFQVESLGKPTPGQDGLIRIALSTLSSLPSPGLVYEARVAAVGAGGSTSSAVSNTFTWTAACAYAVTPSLVSAPAGGSSATVTVTAGAGCAWTSAASAAWISIGSASATGSGSGSVAFTVAANTSASPRSATVTIAGQVVTVNQAAATCSYTASPTSLVAPVGGGGLSVSMIATTGCTWTATSNSAWLRVTSGMSGTGNGTVGLTADANASTTSRTANVSMGGRNVAVTQAGAACTYAVTPTTVSAVSAGATGSLAVTAGGGCGWAAVSHVSWVTLTSGASGSGSGTVQYQVAANTSTSARTGTLTVAGRTVTITQAAAACSYTVSPTSSSVGAGATSVTVSLATTSTCTWTASSQANWLTLTSASSGTGNGSVTFNVAANTSQQSRTGSLTVGGRVVSVSQAASACTFTVSPTSQVFAALGGTIAGLVTTQNGCAWTASSPDPWVTVTASGTGTSTFALTASANSGDTSRTATLTVAGQPVAITQDGTCTVSVLPVAMSLDDNGGPTSALVSAVPGCRWTAASSAGWMVITAGASGVGDGTVTFTVDRNSGPERAGTLVIGRASMPVTQAAQGAPKAPARLRVTVAEPAARSAPPQ